MERFLHNTLPSKCHRTNEDTYKKEVAAEDGSHHLVSILDTGGDPELSKERFCNWVDLGQGKVSIAAQIRSTKEVSWLFMILLQEHPSPKSRTYMTIC